MSASKFFVVLSGLGYDVRVEDCQVIFEQTGVIYGTHTQFAFERPMGFNNSPGIWYFVWLDSSSDRVPACHLSGALEFCEQYFGESFKPYKGGLYS